MIELIDAELKRIGADEIDVEPSDGDTVCIYDTQERATYRADDALRALSGVENDAGFEGAWLALARLEEAS
jgi:hypothetical protein